MDTPFGRQPRPVMVIIHGDDEDIQYWRSELMRRAEFKGDATEYITTYSGKGGFKIYPRAVND